MRFRIAAPVTGLLAVTGVLLATGLNVVPARAQVVANNICTPPTTTESPTADDAQCLNLTNGDVADGTPIQFWVNDAQGEANNAWTATIIGTVKDGEGGVLWPFDDGSGLNTRYNGDNVYQFSFEFDESYCVIQTTFTELELDGCASTTYEDFVLSQDGYLICAGASNYLYSETGTSDQPVWVTDEFGTGNGDFATEGTSANLTWSINLVTLAS